MLRHYKFEVDEKRRTPGDRLYEARGELKGRLQNE
jgi:hypothetical protein